MSTFTGRLFVLLILLFPITLVAQIPTPIFVAKHQLHAEYDEVNDGPDEDNKEEKDNIKDYTSIKNNIKAFDIYKFNPGKLFKQIKGQVHKNKKDVQFIWKLGKMYNWNLKLEENIEIIDDTEHDDLILLKGLLKDAEGGEVRLMIEPNRILGFISYKGEKVFVETLSFIDNKFSEEEIVAYHQKDVTKNDHKCSATHHKNYKEQVQKNIESANSCTALELEIATAATDGRMKNTTDGTISGVNNHILGILNAVEANYNAFNIRFNIVEQVVFDCNSTSCPAWAASLNPDELLLSFSSWAPTGFQKNHDVGILFFNGGGSGVVGKAWVGSLCSGSYRYSVVDYLGNAERDRVLVAHEVAHNLGSSHDPSGSPYIMAPSVDGNATEFSPTSISAMENVINARTCLECYTNPDPLPDPSVNEPPNINATTFTVEEGSPVGTYVGKVIASDPNEDKLTFSILSGNKNNAFEIGPSSGTIAVKNADAIDFEQKGKYSLKVEVKDPGGLTDQATITIEVIDVPEKKNRAPIAVFVSDQIKGLAPLNVTFDASNSNDPDGDPLTYDWDFGDGGSDNKTVVSHTYQEVGIYQVELVVSDGIEKSEPYNVKIEVVNPSQSILAPLEDSYTNNSKDHHERNYGHHSKLFARNKKSWGYESYIKFDISAWAQVENATLRLNGNNPNNNRTVLVEVKEAGDNWSEKTLNFLNAPSEGSKIGEFTVNGTEKYHEVDVTAFVRKEALGDGTVTFKVVSKNSNYERARFHSKESKYPTSQLVVSGAQNVYQADFIDKDLQANEAEEISFSIHVYPNPFEGIIHYELEGDIGTDFHGIINMIDVNGRTVYENRISGDSGYIQFDQSVTKGLYILHIRDGEKIMGTKRVAKTY